MEIRELIKIVVEEYIKLDYTSEGRDMSLDKMIDVIEKEIKQKFIKRKKELKSSIIERKIVCEFTDLCPFLMINSYCDKKCINIMENLFFYTYK